MKTLTPKPGEGVPPTSGLKIAWENPLIPNKRLRQLYAAMVELRLLEQHLASFQHRKKVLYQFHLHPNQEACLVSTVLSLSPGDLTSESLPGLAIEFLRGAKLTALLSRATPTAKRPLSELPPLTETFGRLHLVIGAALALASTKKSPLAVSYVYAGDLTSREWKLILKLAATQTAPVLFVVLPHPGKTPKPGQLSLTATICGVPGIPVDAADPVALYRVAQESMLRIRAGGGPVLMECIPFQIPGKKSEQADPILIMQQFMLPRGVATEAWFNEVATSFAGRLKATAK